MEIQFSFKISPQKVLDEFFNDEHLKVLDKNTFKYAGQTFKVCYSPFNNHEHNDCDMYFETLRTGNSAFVDNVVSIIIDKIENIATTFDDNAIIHIGIEYFESDSDIERISEFSSKDLK